MGLNLLNRLKDELKEIAQVDQEPSLEGRQLYGLISSKKEKIIKEVINMGYKLKTHSGAAKGLRKLVHLLKVEVLTAIIS